MYLPVFPSPNPCRICPIVPRSCRLVCRISGTIMNEHNAPMVLPNGHVYGAEVNHPCRRCPRLSFAFRWRHLCVARRLCDGPALPWMSFVGTPVRGATGFATGLLCERAHVVRKIRTPLVRVRLAGWFVRFACFRAPCPCACVRSRWCLSPTYPHTIITLSSPYRVVIGRIRRHWTA